MRDAAPYLEANADALIVIDEVQRMPQLFAPLRALVDASRRPGRFLLLGSSSPELVRSISESLVKSPKLYVRDSGLLHALLGIPGWDALQGHPVVGFSWEGFAIEHVLATRPEDDVTFYRIATGAELDLMVWGAAGQREAFEMKLGTDPQPTRGFWNAVDDLTLDSVTVLHAGDGRWPLRSGVEARALLDVVGA